jgi:hypothetical protein
MALSRGASMSAAETSPFTVLTNIIAAPGRAYPAIQERPSFWLPLLILIVTNSLVSFVYTTHVDLAWLIDQQLSAAGNMTDEQRAQAVKAATRLPAALYCGIGAVAPAIILPLVLALTALYYRGVSFATGDGIKYKQWFALASWCSLPVVFGVIASLVHVLSGDARFMPQEELNPFSFGNLLGVDQSHAPTFERVVLRLDITAFWSVALSVLGYQTFSKRSLAFAAGVVLAPVVLIVAGVLALLAGRT